VEIAGVVALVLFLAFLALAVVATARTVKAVRRTVSRGSAQARRVVEDNRLRARRYTLTGPAGELAQLRLDLRASIDSTFAALEDGRTEDPSLAEAASLFARLNDQARALDGELRLLEREPDRSRLAERLPGLADRTQRITHAADSLRWAAQDRARRFADDELTGLSRDIELEADALRHWKPVDPPPPGGRARRPEVAGTAEAPGPASGGSASGGPAAGGFAPDGPAAGPGKPPPGGGGGAGDDSGRGGGAGESAAGPGRA
jgi:hypothetical protein